jgi:hypothetical protein
VAPSVAQIHTRRQTVESGATLTSLTLFSAAPGCHPFRIQLFLELSRQFRQQILLIPLHRARDFARLDVGSLFFAELLYFFKVDLLTHFDCT